MAGGALGDERRVVAQADEREPAGRELRGDAGGEARELVVAVQVSDGVVAREHARERALDLLGAGA